MLTLPATAACRYMRLSDWLTQRSPSLNRIGTTGVLPCSRMLDECGSSPADRSSSVSAETFGMPAALSTAPPVPAEFWHPCPELPLLAHGHAPALPSPKQNAE